MKARACCGRARRDLGAGNPSGESDAGLQGPERVADLFEHFGMEAAQARDDEPVFGMRLAEGGEGVEQVIEVLVRVQS